MAEQSRQSASPQVSFQSNTNLRHRGPSRAATFAEGTSNLQSQRRNSLLSDSVSEARHSIRSSTDDLLFPRVNKGTDTELSNEESHWHSAPLALALLPAIAGVFFKNGSAVITDVTLLVLAAIFLNWSVRLPWDWYRSAQAIRQQEPKDYGVNEFPPDLETDDNQRRPESNDDAIAQKRQRSAAASAASKELQIHELAALASCFIFPMIGTWLLHAIRSKLSRPSEGLVSNYNLTIFLLASEIRPFSHLLKMVQGRTLYLQRIVASSPNEDEKLDASKIQDLNKRLEELEAHVAEAAAARLSSDSSDQPKPSPKEQESLQSLVSQAAAEIRKGFQPEIDALNRAVRRYEKRTAVTTFQTETRLQELESQVHDAIAMAAASQRSSAHRRQSFAFTLLDWACAVIVVPTQFILAVTSFPARTATWCLGLFKSFLVPRPPSPRASKGKLPQRRTSQSPRRLQKVPNYHKLLQE